MKNNIKYIAGIPSCALVLLYVTDLIDSFSIISLIHAISFGIIAIAIFLSIPTIAAIGYGVLAFERLVYIVKDCVIRDLPLRSPFHILWGILVVHFLLLLIASIKTKSSKVLGLIASILVVVAIIFIKIIGSIEGFSVNTQAYLIWGTYIINAILSGIAFSNKAEFNSNAPSQVISQRVVESSSTERLIKLKDLLDRGIITQEEFDAKKKEILNL